jgi:DNA-binding PadR family transcriptional regulator
MSKTSKTSYAVLGMLSIAPMSGYDIRQTMKESTSNFWSESDGQLYPALASLHKQGLISCKMEKNENEREKKIYSITAKGMALLTQWLTRAAETQSVRSEILLKLFFGANVSPDVSREHIQMHCYQTKSMLAQLAASKKQLQHEHKDSPHLPYWLMSIDYGMQIAEAKLAWCDGVIEKLNKMKSERK